MNASLEKVRYGDANIRFRVVPSAKCGSRISIHVYPNGRVQVDAPEDCSPQEIKQAVLRQGAWIHQRLRKIGRDLEHVLPREYISGETHWYLGRRYVLKLVPSEENRVLLKGGLLRVYSAESDRTKVRDALYDWYAERGKMIFDQTINEIARRLPWVQDTPQWQQTLMTSRWGSCSVSGRLSLNTHLIKAPRQAIKYVVLHELCHLKHGNHGPEFYQLLDRYMKGWRSVKQRLDEKAEVYLNC